VNRARLRPRLLTAAFLALVVVAWWFFAPTKIGGSTRYVVTKGVSMEPAFHAGDLAITRPPSHYRVGDVAAYWSTLLHTVALHRIIAIHGNRYTFKGDNNNFIDPTHPTRAQLLGKLWIHVHQGGVWFKFLHSPVVAAIVCALLGLFLVFGFREERRRRKRRRQGATGSLLQGTALVNKSPDHSVRPSLNFGAFLTASAVAAAVFLVLGLFSFAQPQATPTEVKTPYTQQVGFGYSADAPAGPVYPTGAVRSGDPIFLSLIHRLRVHVNYRFSTTAQHGIAGTEEILLQLTAPSGWSRTIVLTPATHFSGDQTSTTVTLDIPQLQSLLRRVAAQTGMPGVTYTIAVQPRLHITGTVAGDPVNLSFDPAMNFQLGSAQLVAQGATGSSRAASTANPTAPATSSAATSASRAGAVGTPATVPHRLTVLGVSLQIRTLRVIAIVGLVLSIAMTIFFYLRKRGEPFEETVRIQAKYGHMIVPIVGGEDLGWPPVDVPSITALVKLAESGQRLILHNRSDNIDTYMLNEEGTVYRYQVKPSKVVWGDWSDGDATPVKAAA
jgi:signal peptidase I